ncbi:hypothetical protein [Conexibacter arvalis]|uniref:Uncharacterized protein n=1 Tax=Conexibacter arvalis TaxID=912552 RepID=A0A840IB74_9ACTN|nr:hypothetical protein [Conexibacter arvalis]MBB4662086.1 hypothetical protein [Conexibacter arvalis]
MSFAHIGGVPVEEALLGLAPAVAVGLAVSLRALVVRQAERIATARGFVGRRRRSGGTQRMIDARSEQLDAFEEHEE